MYSHGSFVFFLINSFYGSLKKAKLEIISRKPVRIMMIDRLVSSVEKCCLMVKKKYHNVGKNRVLHHRNWFDSAHTQDKVSVWSISLMLSLMTKQPAAHKKSETNNNSNNSKKKAECWTSNGFLFWYQHGKHKSRPHWKWKAKLVLWPVLNWHKYKSLVSMSMVYVLSHTKLGPISIGWQRETLMELFRV